MPCLCHEDKKENQEKTEGNTTEHKKLLEFSRTSQILDKQGVTQAGVHPKVTDG